MSGPTGELTIEGGSDFAFETYALDSTKKIELAKMTNSNATEASWTILLVVTDFFRFEDFNFFHLKTTIKSENSWRFYPGNKVPS